MNEIITKKYSYKEVLNGALELFEKGVPKGIMHEQWCVACVLGYIKSKLDKKYGNSVGISELLKTFITREVTLQESDLPLKIARDSIGGSDISPTKADAIKRLKKALNKKI